MAIITSSIYQTLSGVEYTGEGLAALNVWCLAVDSAIKRALHPYVPEPATYTDKIMNAPPTMSLVMDAFPVRSITSICLNWGANGDPTAFTADDLLDPYTDYYLPIDPVYGYSNTGIVYRRGARFWGWEYTWGIGRLGYNLNPCIGAIKATYEVGPTSTPTAIVGAASLAVSLLMNRRATGAPAQSEGWNGYNYSAASQLLATSILDHPDVAAMLAPYKPGHVGAI
jgi:hypothetical protein